MTYLNKNKVNMSAPSDFDRITISLASPEEILRRSYGEILKPETINYRTYKPERDGLFCERIFGPTKDYECACGKYKRIRYKGIVCDRCGVEVTEKKVRREREGHISLVVPVVHIWYARTNPNKIAYLLGVSGKKLESIVYYEKYVVVQPGIKEKEGIKQMDFLSEEEFLEILDSLPKENHLLDNDDPNKFIALMGGDAIFELLRRIDVDDLYYDLKDKVINETAKQRRNDALKRLRVVSAFRQSRHLNKPEWMVLKVLPVIPPDIRPLVPLDGGRFATSDLNDLYRRVIIRNNRLKRLIEIKAPEVIMRNEKRMLQEAVDSLLDNSKKSTAVKNDNRPLKSLSDFLRGKQGRFRQNLLGKRVDYSARSVIVVGPELEMHECGLPKNIAAELFKPFIIRKLIERGIVKTVKSAKKIVDRKDPVIWEILENVMKGHPVLLNRAPTLHRLGIQAFQPKLIEGKAIQLHPLVCTPFNADFDGDQMAVHLPLGNAAVLEAQILMLASHNILNPANGAPITVPSQDMVLGLYYITKEKISTPERKVKGENLIFSSTEEALIAYNERAVDLHARVKVRTTTTDATGIPKTEIIQTTLGRIIFNQHVPSGVGYLNGVLSKKSLRKIITDVISIRGTSVAARFLDDIKALGFEMAFKGGLSFNLDDVIIPDEKKKLVDEGNAEVEDVIANYNLGLLTFNERYNQIIDIWTHVNTRLTNILIKNLQEDNHGFNSIYMMLDSGARGSKEQIKQLSGMRGLMNKPQKSGSAPAVIENPILANFKEGLSVLEYFISTHGARKGLADTALKTADAGYLTRRLVDVSQDVIVNEEDCGTLRGLAARAIKKDEEIVESLYDRILGRTSVHDIYHPITTELIIGGGEEITEEVAELIEKSPIEEIEIRSVLTCESKRGVCAKCYGRNLSNGRRVKAGEAVGVIAAQSIGEPGTQLTLRTFHLGGVAGGSVTESSITAKYAGRVIIDDLRTTTVIDDEGEEKNIVVSRMAEMKIMDTKTTIILSTHQIPYGSTIFFKSGDDVNAHDLICQWDPFNNVIISEKSGTAKHKNLLENITYKLERDEQTNFIERVVIETKDKTKIPEIEIVDENGARMAIYNLPVGARVIVKDGEAIDAGQVIVKIPRIVGKTGDITGGLPRVTELFEARNPSNPAVVSEIDGLVSFGEKIRRGNKEIIITPKTGKSKKYLVPLSKQILVQEEDHIKAGTPLCDGHITPADILRIKGPVAVQEYLVNEIQEVYRLQGVTINDKHFEVIVRQMMRKVEVEDAGDSDFLQGEIVERIHFLEENDRLFGKKIIVDPGDSQRLKKNQIVSLRKLRDENSYLKRRDLKLIEVRDAIPATSVQILQGITKSALQTTSFLSAASFQETTKVLNDAAIRGKSDFLAGLKENVLVGHLIPAGTGFRSFQDVVVGPRDTMLPEEEMENEIED
ncbi:MAG: DNA-directed RNA polymerase subunit beta' [Bacteroidales bacterium]|nr:DNA-directed RNA polymerase subunit beta' [Bacteroidales bacterium]